jgi:hypothetical protein
MSDGAVRRPPPLQVVRGQATSEELHALHQVLARRQVEDRLLRWRQDRRRALRRRPESVHDR